MSKIAVVGNCQGGPIRQVLRFLAPGSETVFFPLGYLMQRYGSVAGLLQALWSFDVIFCQEFGADAIPGINSNILARSLPNVALFPVIVFPAFHPDIVYVHRRGRDGSVQMVDSPVGHYHSSLILYAFLQDYTAKQTERLYEANVLQRVGFLDAWSDSQAALLEAGQRVGMPLDKEFAAWTRRGCFMHSMNHPRLFTLVDIARSLLKRAGIAAIAEDPTTYIVDYLMAKAIWPVYPAIADALGCVGGLVFKRDAADVYINLGGMIEASFAAYGRLGGVELVCPRVEAWRRDPALSEALRGWVAA